MSNPIETPNAEVTVRETPSHTPETEAARREAALPHVDDPDGRSATYGRERAAYGGIKFGVAFFGWLTATGLTAILGAVVAGAAPALGFTASKSRSDFGAALTAAIVLVVILFISYLAGGYVAGRMARFAGAKQGVAVWVWGVVVTALLAVVAAIAGSRFDILSFTGIVPIVNFGNDQMVARIVTIGGAVVVALLAARPHGDALPPPSRSSG